MQILKGKPISPGYAKGIAVVYDNEVSVQIPHRRIHDGQIDQELERFEAAVQRSRMELQQLEQRVLHDLGDTYSSIFSAHLAFLGDRNFKDRVQARVRDERLCAEQAVNAQISDLARQLESMENEYFQERAIDIRDLGNRLMRQLMRGETARYVELAPRSIIVARELLPSETIDLDRRHVVGIVTEAGGENSHAAILARALGIPAVTGVRDATSLIAPGSALLVDGNAGQLTLSPTDEASDDLATLKSDYDDASAQANLAEAMDCVTSDGVRVSLLANLNRVDEAALVAAHHLDGVGLFRTEFLCMDSPHPPTIEQHREVYRGLLDCLGNKKLVIRTLDLGGDKVPLYLQSNRESNPNLGLRGLRFALSQPDLFMAQLRALADTSPRGNLHVLFPMVLGRSDLEQACEQMRELTEVLEPEHRPKLGAMIETPSSLFCLPEILQQVDFVSIGTNDLTQFLLAVDRDSAELTEEHSVIHPAVLRAIRQVVQKCAEVGCQVSVCGEAAGDLRTAALLVGLGVRELSMSPLRAARVRLGIRESSASELTGLADRAVESDSAMSVSSLIREFWNDALQQR